jgi:DMSO/TMAO reductase YedYZ molybdopterin-dependent catalytic subunit
VRTVAFWCDFINTLNKFHSLLPVLGSRAYLSGTLGNQSSNDFLFKHRELTRRYFLRLGAAGAMAVNLLNLGADENPIDPELDKAIAAIEPYFTSPSKFRDVSRGKPLPHSLPEDKKRQVGLTRDTWKLDIIPDPDNPATLRRSLSRQTGTAFDFPALMKLSEKHAVRFAKVMTCLNIGCPLGTGIWEGVPLREIVSLTQPRENLRRIFYYGYHNDDPTQMFRSSLPIDRVLEDPYDLPPVILCYKLNGDWLDSERGGPVRVVVPEGYGFKSIKWVSHLLLTNLYQANDTYADGNNDVESWLKSFAATLSIPKRVKPGDKIPVTGYAQVGLAGLTKVQVSIQLNDGEESEAEWNNARILSPPNHWGNLADGKIPAGTFGFDPRTGQPRSWPLRLAKVHWAVLLPGLPAGEYTFRSRTVDEKGIAQPGPRPFRNSGHSAIESVEIKVG